MWQQGRADREDSEQLYRPFAELMIYDARPTSRFATFRREAII
jgi:hypothetical protein